MLKTSYKGSWLQVLALLCERILLLNFEADVRIPCVKCFFQQPTCATRLRYGEISILSLESSVALLA